MFIKIHPQLKLLFWGLLFSIMLSGFFFFADIQTVNAVDTGLQSSASKAFGSNIPFSKTGGIPGAIGLLIGAVLSFVGVLFLVLMIYGGILWMTARGNEQQTEKARDLIIAAVIGLIIVLSAYAVTSFIGEQIQ